MSHIVIIGCGIVGAMIAYELSQVPGLKVTVLDQQSPAQGATGAALGVLMGVISHKTKGRAWQMRQLSLQRYETLIPELEALTGRQIPFNRQGLMLLIPKQELENAGEDMAAWEKLVEVRHSQGWQLEIWDSAHVKANVKAKCPHLDCEQIQSVVYSPQDRQIEPVALTLALVDAAQRRGVDFHFGVTVEGYDLDSTSDEQRCRKVHTMSRDASLTRIKQLHNVDWLVVAAGLGSLNVCQEFKLAPPIDIRPVLGQALHLQLKHPVGNPDFQPVITGNDVHIVPVGKGEYWVGATVEFPADGAETVPLNRLNAVMQQAIAFCPSLAKATVVKTWSGLRPRPEGRPAPIIGQLPGYSNVLLATGHYRNGVLLAPATAQAIREMISSRQDASAKRSRRR